LELQKSLQEIISKTISEVTFKYSVTLDMEAMINQSVVEWSNQGG